ncbi:MAG: hypothetical protein IIB69_08160 [Proteobacteria bacterium]|nr:hypothetical protein [Pseudomonadota bacterium]
MANNLQEKMFREMEQKRIFEQAKDYAFDYVDKALERKVFPVDDAIKDLNLFVEKLPEATGDAAEILKQLHRQGSPATISQIGGRYFGLVNGCVIPAALVIRFLGSKHSLVFNFTHRIETGRSFRSMA